MFSIIIQCATVEIAISMLAAIRATGSAAEVVTTTKAKPGKPATDPKVADMKPTVGAAKTESAAQETKGSDAIPYDMVSKAITSGVAKDKAKVVAVLTKHGVKNGKELKPAQYAEFLADLSASLGAEEDLG